MRRSVGVLTVVLRVSGLIIAAVLVAHALLVLFEVGEGNMLAWMLARAANGLALGTQGLFNPADPKVGAAVNSAVAALAWLALTTVVALLPRRSTRARFVPEERQNRGHEETDGYIPTPGQTPRRLRRLSKIALVTVGIVTVLEAGGFTGTYFLYTSHYVTTDNAQVDGDKIDINAPTTGTLSDWSVNEGSPVRTNQVVGRVEMLGSGAQPERTVKSPGKGTIAIDNAVNGTYVTQGTELATAYDLSHVYVTARVPDTEVAEVHPGKAVDISVDAYPNTPVTGVVDVVQGSASSLLTPFPSPSGGDPSNPQKVDQYIAVKIVLTNTDGAALMPGMNVTAHIHKE